MLNSFDLTPFLVSGANTIEILRRTARILSVVLQTPTTGRTRQVSFSAAR